MANIRVFEAAKQHGLEVQDLLGALVSLGAKVRSHMSPVDEADVAKALASLGGVAPAAPAAPAEAAAATPKPLVRRRKKVEESDSADEGPAVEEVVPPVAPETPPEAELPPPAPPEPEPAEPEPPTPPTEEAPAVEPPTATVPPAEAAAEPGPEATPEAVADAPAEAATEPPKEEFRLKVVRFIHPPLEDRAPPRSPGGGAGAPRGVGAPRPPTRAPSAPAPGAPGPATAPGGGVGAPPGGPYHQSKQEREARKAEKKSKKKKGVRKEEVRPDGRRAPQKTQITVPKAIKRRIRIAEVITIADLAHRMGLKGTEIIRKLMGLGVLATINQTIDVDTAALVASEFGYEVENVAVAETEMLAQVEDRPEDLVLRPPVVTVMGHVDHGKTSLLDAIRTTRVAAGEAGGITQHIGAYEVTTSRGHVVFLDTPGHEAFTALRARGAKVTDITVLVVAADDGIMPQTVEAIDHSKAAGVPIIVAINKMDRADADPDRVKRSLLEHGLAPEGWGGDVICVPVSAKKLTGVDTLLEMIALQAEVLELRANPKKPAAGTVIEARVDRGRGVVATVLVQAGTLRPGDIVLAGQHYGRVRTLLNDQGKRVKEATPSIPVEITGLSGVPEAGEPFVVVDSERTAKEIAGRRGEKAREAEMGKARRASLADFASRLAEGEVKELPLIIKADVQGSVEALTQSLGKLSTDEVKIKIIHGGVGGITENDVNLAAASQAIIVGFSVRPEAKAAALASQIGVDVRLYKVIYDATDDVKKALEGLLAPTREERVLGRAEIRQIFRVPKIGVVAGCHVIQGIIQRSARLRLLRDSVVVFQGELASLKRFKDDAREVREGFDCGLSIHNYNDVKEGDVLEFFVVDEVQRTL